MRGDRDPIEKKGASDTHQFKKGLHFEAETPNFLKVLQNAQRPAHASLRGNREDDDDDDDGEGRARDADHDDEAPQVVLGKNVSDSDAVKALGLKDAGSSNRVMLKRIPLDSLLIQLRCKLQKRAGPIQARSDQIRWQGTKRRQGRRLPQVRHHRRLSRLGHQPARPRSGGNVWRNSKPSRGVPSSQSTRGRQNRRTKRQRRREQPTIRRSCCRLTLIMSKSKEMLYDFVASGTA
ncbi:hypothetical protein BC830DRAFT_1146332 [Chytriomyces sp. MP71]|nr:hypothetical protein BC830DRAFT_1146332 [Chytriomyces sp. MP71]